MNFIDYFFKNFKDVLFSLDGVLNPEVPAMNYAGLIAAASIDSSQLVLSILRCAIEALDKAYCESSLRKSSYHIRNRPARTLITFFGELTYRRYLYNHKSDKKSYFCFLDHVLGIPPHIQYDTCIRAELVETTLSQVSMGEAGRIVGEKIKGFSIDKDRRQKKAISRQTVANIMHSLPDYVFEVARSQTTPETIFIIADEKYKSLQGEKRDDGKAKKHMTKLCIIFEGIKKECKGRYKLINKYAVAGHEANFWDIVFDVLNKRYDLEKIKTITIMGDGASWIKKGAEDLKMNEIETNFLLDKFHTMQAVNHISKTFAPALRNYVQEDEKEDFKMMLEIIKQNYDPKRQERMDEKAKYLLNNWRSIQLMYHKSSFGCPMESQIQHVLASKISSVPKAYNREYLKKLVKLLAEKENGTDIKALYLTGIYKANENNVVNMEEPMDWSIFDKSPDNYDKNNSGKSIARLLKKISQN